MKKNNFIFRFTAAGYSAIGMGAFAESTNIKSALPCVVNSAQQATVFIAAVERLNNTEQGGVIEWTEEEKKAFDEINWVPQVYKPL